MQCREPRALGEDVVESVWEVIALCTGTGSQPWGDWVIFASSRPTRRGIEGPVRSMSRMPTDLPWRERARASWRVTEDFPTPPLPDRTCDTISLAIGALETIRVFFVSCAHLRRYR